MKKKVILKKNNYIMIEDKPNSKISKVMILLKKGMRTLKKLNNLSIKLKKMLHQEKVV